MNLLNHMEAPLGGVIELLVLFMFRIIPAVIILCQVLLVIHLFKNNRSKWWLAMILFFPIVGVIAYFCLEVWPDWQGGRSLLSKRSIKVLEGQLLYSDTIANRLELAQAYVAAGTYDKAIALYEYCLKNNSSNKAKIQLMLAELYFKVGDVAQSRENLHKLNDDDIEKELKMQKQFLLAKIYEVEECPGEALAIYRDLLRKFHGEEVRLRLAMLLKKQGETSEAKALFQEIIQRSKHSPAFYAKAQKQWIKQARKYC